MAENNESEIAQDERKSLDDSIKYIDGLISTASENGLFKYSTSFDGIIQNLRAARDGLTRGPTEFSTVHMHLSKASDDYYKALDSAPLFFWRFTNIYGGHVWTYLISFLSLTFIFFYFNLDILLSVQLHIDLIAITATTWGIVGGILQGLWYLWINVDKMQLRKVWVMRFVSAPFIGGIMGALVYFLIIGGLLVLSQDEGDPRPITLIVAAILAGFNWDWALDRLKDFGSKLANK